MKSYKLHDDKFHVTVTVLDGSAAGVYETNLHDLTENVSNEIWDTRTTIIVDGIEKNLKLRIDDCTELAEWVAAWRADSDAQPTTCHECGCGIPAGDGTTVSRMFRGSKILVVICDDCSDSIHS